MEVYTDYNALINNGFIIHTNLFCLKSVGLRTVRSTVSSVLQAGY